MTNLKAPSVLDEHGVGLACYSGGPGQPYYQPTMTCMCGWSTGRQESWQECGRLFDEHLPVEAK